MLALILWFNNFDKSTCLYTILTSKNRFCSLRALNFFISIDGIVVLVATRQKIMLKLLCGKKKHL